MSVNNFLDKRVSMRTIFTLMVFFLVFSALILYFSFGGIKEGFQAALVGIGAAIDYKMGDGVKKSWENSNTILNSSNPLASIDQINDASNIYSNLEKNEGGEPLPLPEDELLMFDKNKFSPECCPAPYSNADGCVCASPEQMKYLNERGGNRTLTGEY
jgi:hypothetical protein